MKTNPNAHYSRPIYFFRHLLEFVRQLRSASFSHCRCHPASPNSLQIYLRDASMPRGVRAGASLDRAYGEEVLARLNRSGRQLSPTEGLHG